MEFKDFDTDRAERENKPRVGFKIGGVQFECRRAIPPEVLARYLNMGDHSDEEDTIAVLDDTILSFLTPESEASWLAMRKTQLAVKEDNPVSTDDLVEVIRYLMAATSGRPTTPPSDSPSPQGGNGTGSTEPFSAPEAAASTSSTSESS